MDGFHPDILDHLGRTPREFGWLQIHCEPVVRGPSGSCGRMWLQAAFEPHGDAELRFGWMVDAEPQPRREFIRVAVPPVHPGGTIRWTLPLSIPATVEELTLEIDAPLAERTERVRPAWKILPTIEQPRPGPRGAPSSRSDAAVVVGALLLGGPLVAGAVLGYMGMQSRSGTGLPNPAEPNSARVEPAFLSLPVRPAEGPVSEQARIEVLWQPGQPLPNAERAVVPPPRSAAPATPASKRCGDCAFKLDEDDLRRGTCPACGAALSD